MELTKKFFKEELTDILLSYDMDEDADFRELSIDTIDAILEEFEDSLEMASDDGWSFDELTMQLMDDAYGNMGKDILLDAIIERGLSILLEEVKNLF